MYRTLRRPEQELRGDSSVSPERPSRARGRHEHEEPEIEPLLTGAPRRRGCVEEDVVGLDVAVDGTTPPVRSLDSGWQPASASASCAATIGLRNGRAPAPAAALACAAQPRVPLGAGRRAAGANGEHHRCAAWQLATPTRRTSIPDPSIHERWID
jgi:hypothetical protein